SGKIAFWCVNCCSNYNIGNHFRPYTEKQVSVFSELNLHERGGQSAEKPISGFSDSAGELQLA
ncbi:hypothetical protein, partial [Paenibacillus germinis]|uniref:hypothetical protein n=1 Tax=Paenibacillus germinis TaxID=2654979 RepID=UPI001C107FEF